MEAGPGGITIVSNYLLLNSNQFQMELQEIYSDSCLDYQWFYVWRRTHCQALTFDSKWMEPDAGSITSLQNSS